MAVNPVLNSNADINFSYGLNLTIWSSGVESEEAVSAVSPSRPDPVPGSPPRAVGAQSVPALCFSRYPGVYRIPSRSAGTLRALHSGRGRLRSFRATLGSLQPPLDLPGHSHFRLTRDAAVGGAADSSERLPAVGGAARRADGLGSAGPTPYNRPPPPRGDPGNREFSR